MQKITPFLWFDNNLEEAMNFYTSIFKNARITNVSKNGGEVFTATFELEGQQFMGLNGGPMFKFTEAVSFFVSCETQAEVDDYWQKLIAGGGQESRCGWLKDKFGLSWQIIPDILGELLHGKDQWVAKNVMDAMLKMGKIDIAALEAAAKL
jgi:predicted 3-demethylubiquinone-9 3-methyltransferase (glyoxalase superfamily)